MYYSLEHCTLIIGPLKTNYVEHEGSNIGVDQSERLPLFPFGSPIGIVPAASCRACS